MIENIMYGKLNKVSRSIHKIIKEGINSVTIIRSLSNYLIRINLTQIEMKKKKNFDEAVKILRPPVF